MTDYLITFYKWRYGARQYRFPLRGQEVEVDYISMIQWLDNSPMGKIFSNNNIQWSISCIRPSSVVSWLDDEQHLMLKMLGGDEIAIRDIASVPVQLTKSLTPLDRYVR